MIYSAFLVLITIISSQSGDDHRELTIKVPWSNMADCEAYLKDPAEIQSNYQDTFKVKHQGTRCEPRVQKGEKPA